jgi:hypothetical protein
MTDTVAATFSPLNSEGSEAGSSTERSVRSREAPMLRMSFKSSGSTERRPSSRLTVIGKKQISATIAIVGRMPKSNRSTKMGASTTIGTAWEATSSG